LAQLDASDQEAHREKEGMRTTHPKRIVSVVLGVGVLVALAVFVQLPSGFSKPVDDRPFLHDLQNLVWASIDENPTAPVSSAVHRAATLMQSREYSGGWDLSRVILYYNNDSRAWHGVEDSTKREPRLGGVIILAVAERARGESEAPIYTALTRDGTFMHIDARQFAGIERHLQVLVQAPASTGE